MTKPIIAFFASSFLCVSLIIPVLTEEKSGIIAKVDREKALLTLMDGSIYGLPGEFDYDAIEPGMEAHLILALAS